MAPLQTYSVLANGSGVTVVAGLCDYRVGKGMGNDVNVLRSMKGCVSSPANHADIANVSYFDWAAFYIIACYMYSGGTANLKIRLVDADLAWLRVAHPAVFPSSGGEFVYETSRPAYKFTAPAQVASLAAKGGAGDEAGGAGTQQSPSGSAPARRSPRKSPVSKLKILTRLDASAYASFAQNEPKQSRQCQ